MTKFSSSTSSYCSAVVLPSTKKRVSTPFHVMHPQIMALNHDFIELSFPHTGQVCTLSLFFSKCKRDDYLQLSPLLSSLNIILTSDLPCSKIFGVCTIQLRYRTKVLLNIIKSFHLQCRTKVLFNIINPFRLQCRTKVLFNIINPFRLQCRTKVLFNIINPFRLQCRTKVLFNIINPFRLQCRTKVLFNIINPFRLQCRTKVLFNIIKSFRLQCRTKVLFNIINPFRLQCRTKVLFNIIKSFRLQCRTKVLFNIIKSFEALNAKNIFSKGALLLFYKIYRGNFRSSRVESFCIRHFLGFFVVIPAVFKRCMIVLTVVLGIDKCYAM